MENENPIDNSNPGFFKRNKQNIFLVLKIFIFLIFFIPTGMLVTSYIMWFQKRDLIIKNLDSYYKEVSSKTAIIKSRPIKIFDINEKLIGEFNRKSFKPIRTDNIKDHATIIWALLSSEDRDFFQHGGINFSAVFRAFIVNLAKMRLSQGGSTITQQLAKLTLNLGERNLMNKLSEVFCTYYIESNYNKESILAMYMNQIYMGEGNTGLEEASRFYYSKSAKELSPAEAALLVGLIPAPSVYNPVKNLHIALARQKRVMFDMANNTDLHFNKKKLDQSYRHTISEQIRKFMNQYVVREVKDSQQKKRKHYSSIIGKYGYDKQFRINHAPDFNESVRKFVFDKIPQEELDSKDIRVYTSLDYEKQIIAEAALREGIERVRGSLNDRKNYYIKKNSVAESKIEDKIINSMNGSFVSMNPVNGYIEAMVGAYRISSVYRLNRAEAARRQPGSSIKGLVYALALQKRIINPSSLVIDEKLNISGYSPKNWYKGFKGPITARQAIALSVNTIPVKLLQEIGVNYFLYKLSEILSIPYEVIEKRFGKNLSLALGSGELTPVEMATIYSVIANGGKKVSPKKILRIEDSAGNKLYTLEQDKEEGTQIIDSVACAIALNLMEAVLSEEGTMPVKLSQGEWFPMAGKTGTVQIPGKIRKKWSNRSGIRDAWFVGVFPSNVSAVWVGNDLGAPFPGSGSGITGQIWLKYARYIKVKKGMGQNLVSSIQGDHIQVDVCGDNGKLLVDYPECAHPVYAQYYYRGDEPKKEEIPVASIDPGSVYINTRGEGNENQEGIAFEEEELHRDENIVEEEESLINPFDETLETIDEPIEEIKELPDTNSPPPSSGDEGGFVEENKEISTELKEKVNQEPVNPPSEEKNPPNFNIDKNESPKTETTSPNPGTN
ncbi:MAG: transglycosylase domain-containing protein [Leptospiraceae bacterium]|nr:transglycosylase domain-containing protein [Leptospiraceae bacterium]MCP5500928.1 transglycosylase domain-containing protein [Leptospiraceae bacterium]